jgi:hypothetical protein
MVGNKKVILYCQIGRSLDMTEISIASAIKNAGMSEEDFDIVFICWKTSDEVYGWLKENSYKYVDIGYDEGKGFLWNLYRGWNAGYEIGFEHTDYICPIATDHYFHDGWLANLYRHCAENTVVNCKLIEPGTLPSLHTCINFGLTTKEEFKEEECRAFAESLRQANQGQVATDEEEYGHRFDAMPFVVSKDVWERFGPMSQVLVNNSPDPEGVFVNSVTGDTDFFNRCKTGGVRVIKSLDAISYHCGGIEATRNKRDGVYT